MSWTRPVLRTPLGLAALVLLLLGVVLEVLGGGVPEWFTVGGEVVLRTDYEDLGLSRDDGSLTGLADAFVQVYPAAAFFVSVAVAWSGWAQRGWSRAVAGVGLVALAAGVAVFTRDEAVVAGAAATRSADASIIVLGTGLVATAVLVGLATMMLGVPQWIRCSAGALLVLAFTVGQVVGLAQMLGAATVDASPTALPLMSVGAMLLIAASLVALALAARRAR